MRQDPRHGEEHPGHVQSRIAEPWGDRREPSQCEPGRGDEGMGVQHADQDEVDEEALDPVLPLGQFAVVDVRVGDRDVVGQVPRAWRGMTGEADRRLDARRGRRTRVAEDQRTRLARRVAAARSPLATRAARPLVIQRVEEATTELPTHERGRRTRISEMHRRGTWGWCVRRPEQFQPAVSAIADFCDALRGDRRGRDAARRPSEHLEASGPIAPRVSIAAPCNEVDPRPSRSSTMPVFRDPSGPDARVHRGTEESMLRPKRLPARWDLSGHAGRGRCRAAPGRAGGPAGLRDVLR